LSLVQPNGPAANQTVAHLHVYVLPRQKDDRLLLNWSRAGSGDADHMAEIATQIWDRLPSG
jgi:diadenosine tetraphosphate (Ap4A) HIT family hydrolase